MKRGRLFRISFLSSLSIALMLGGCARKTQNSEAGTPSPGGVQACVPVSDQIITSSTGTAYIFRPDPMVQSGDLSLTPASRSDLNSLRIEVGLERLTGKGVLEGTLVDVRNGVDCDEGYGTFDPNNRFLYGHEDRRFQESMTYYYGDSYRNELQQAGVLFDRGRPVRMVAHCVNEDDAYFVRGRDRNGQIIEKVCFGDSQVSPQAYYSDDAAVVVHELQHASTVSAYSPEIGLNGFWYDEAGGLNEAISDFMALSYLAPMTPDAMDPRLFSRWALGTFDPTRFSPRGAHRCPPYDPTFPNCSNFRADSTGFSVNSNTISYVYPDGMGWAFLSGVSGPGVLKTVFQSGVPQEEIHTTSVVMTGALWDSYEALKSNHGGDAHFAFTTMSKLVGQTLTRLPKPTLDVLSPVTYLGFASELIQSASLLGLSEPDKNAMRTVLKARGLVDVDQVPANWAAVGPGQSPTPGLRILDDPIVLARWLRAIGSDPAIVTQSQDTTNGKLDSGEIAVIWFDVQNTDEKTVGGVELNVISEDVDVGLMNEAFNIGGLSNFKAQIQYMKINGTSVVDALHSSNPAMNVPTGNTYFKTNPQFKFDWTTAIWIKVSPQTAAGKRINFKVDLRPSNGAAATLNFPAVVN